MKATIFWYRRDLRIEDNIALYEALQMDSPVIPVFIFDEEIVDELDKADARVNFIYKRLEQINIFLKEYNSSVRIFKSSVSEAFKYLINEYEIHNVFINEDYEPYALQRDKRVSILL